MKSICIRRSIWKPAREKNNASASDFMTTHFPFFLLVFDLLPGTYIFFKIKNPCKDKILLLKSKNEFSWTKITEAEVPYGSLNRLMCVKIDCLNILRSSHVINCDHMAWIHQEFPMGLLLVCACSGRCLSYQSKKNIYSPLGPQEYLNNCQLESLSGYQPQSNRPDW